MKVVQSADPRQPFTEPDAVRHASELLPNVSPLPIEVAATAPERLVERSVLLTPEILRFVVEAVVK